MNSTIKIQHMAVGALVWTIVPVAIMILFWFRWYYGIPAACLTLYGLCVAVPGVYKAKAFQGSLPIDGRIIAVLLLIIVWMLLIGVGGFIGQEHWDNGFRNAVLSEMIDRPWPVVCSDYTDFAYLNYYFCYWIVPAAFGKLFHSYAAAHIALFIWTYIGLASVVLMMVHYCKRRYLFIAFLTLCFTTPDVINHLIYIVGLGWADDSYVGTHVISAPTAPYLITFIYNQGVPLMVIMTLMFLANDISCQLLLLSALYCYAPIMALPLIPIVAVKMIASLKEAFSVPNIAGLLVAILCSIFYLGNSNGTSIEPLSNYMPVHKILWLLLGWFVFNIGVFLPFVWAKIKGDAIFWSLLVLTAFIAMCVPAYGNYDFGWKAPAALFFYLMLKLFPEIAGMAWNRRNAKAWALGILLAIGLTSNFYLVANIARRVKSVTEAYVLQKPDVNPDRLHRSTWLEGHLFDCERNICYGSFVTDRETLYSKYFMPK